MSSALSCSSQKSGYDRRHRLRIHVAVALNNGGLHSLRVASYNIGGSSRWRHPKLWVEAIAANVRSVSPDLVAFQEFPRRYSELLIAALTRSGLVPGDGGERERVFYCPSAAHPLGHRREQVRAEGENGKPRFLNWSTWVTPDRSLPFDLCNVHLTGAAVKSAASRQLIECEQFRRTIVAGDFNLTGSHYVHKRLCDAGWQDAAESALVCDRGPTYHGHGVAAKDRRIDWVLTPVHWAPMSYGVRRLARVEDEPSDHYLIWADMHWDADFVIRAMQGQHANA